MTAKLGECLRCIAEKFGCWKIYGKLLWILACLRTLLATPEAWKRWPLPPDAKLSSDDGQDCLDCDLIIIILSSSVAEKGAEGCKDLMEAFAACVKSAAEGTS